MSRMEVRTLVAIDPRIKKRDTGACVKPEVVTMVNERPWVLQEGVLVKLETV